MTRISTLIALLLFAPLLAAEPVTFTSSDRQVGLLELYTSEGCSSCPPADRWLSRLKDHPDLWQAFIPIALHVDYWDYIGWKDPFASPANSRRQRQYSREGGVKAVYTPGFVYNGSEWRQWYVSRKVDFPEGGQPGVLRLELERGMAQVQFSPTADSPGQDLQINLALLGFGLETQVGAGENHGRKLPHDFVVLATTRAAMQVTRAGFQGQLNLPESPVLADSYGVVAWLSSPTQQRPIQAVGGPLP